MPKSGLRFLPFLFLFLVLGLALGACAQKGADATVPGVELMSRLGGLWSGPGTGTPLGDFPIIDMDMRAADGHTLFGRTDLDNQNNLRFAFAIETHPDPSGSPADILVFRNGGYFQGVLRDTHAALVESGGDRYRFCALDRGCDYLDATWTLAAADRVTLDVKVRKGPHLLWQATRVEGRSLPTPFPVDGSSVGTGDGPFPPLGGLDVDVGFAALAADADVWVILSQNGCQITGCTPSRSLVATAAAGSTHVALSFQQLHPGDYQAMALLDRARTFRTTLHPNHGDGVTWPLNQPITVAASGSTTTSLRIALDVP